MVVYEVNLSVDRDIEQEFLSWLGGHVERVLRFPGFMGARIYRRDPRDEGAPDEQRFHLTVHYELPDRAAYEAYLERHAPAMRREGLERFPGRFAASRRLLSLEQTVPPGDLDSGETPR